MGSKDLSGLFRRWLRVFVMLCFIMTLFNNILVSQAGNGKALMIKHLTNDNGKIKNISNNSQAIIRNISEEPDTSVFDDGDSDDDDLYDLPISRTPPECHFFNLHRGVTYRMDADPSERGIINPIVTGKEYGHLMQFDADGDVSAKVVSQFLLPQFLENENGSGEKIQCSFSNDDMYWVEGNIRSNPQASNTMSLSPTGKITLSLGVTISVPNTVSPGTYVGQVLWNVYYTGLSISPKNSLRQMGSNAAGTFIVTVTNDRIPEFFALDQNYPNPFNPKTTISFVINKPSFVTLKIYDLLGNEIATLVNEHKERSSYTTSWEPGNIAGGVYYYRIMAYPDVPGENIEPFTETKKLIYVR